MGYRDGHVVRTYLHDSRQGEESRECKLRLEGTLIQNRLIDINLYRIRCSTIVGIE